jgi:RNA polymerase sigma factor (sigma-70 family)
MASMLLSRLRAERLLREQFEALRAVVTGKVAARLRAAGVQLDARDLDACYAIAWHGLYAAVLDGQEIAGPVGWLALVTHRRAIDEHRARKRLELTSLDDADGHAASAAPRAFVAAAVARGERRDLASELDDRMRLRQLLEALRARLSSREREAATLCYLHGFSRAEAAAQMGISETRMRKLMDGHGRSRAGVSAKLGAFVQAIEAGRWCDEQGSLMRGFAYGILDPQGERYTLARAHQAGCPSCRAYVLSLRGLAAVLPPVPAMLHWALGAGAGAGAGAAAAGAGVAAPGAAAGTGASAGLSASGAATAGAGAAGGGWWLAGGPIGAKLAVGCLLALGVGAGCVALEGPASGTGRSVHGRHAHVSAHTHRARAGEALAQERLSAARVGSLPQRPPAAQIPSPSTTVADPARAGREFGLEQPARAHASRNLDGRKGPPPARAASASDAAGTPTAGAAAEATSSGAQASAARPSASSSAVREFAPG